MRLRDRVRRSQPLIRSEASGDSDQGPNSQLVEVEKRQGGQGIQNSSSPSNAVPIKAADPTTLVTSPLNAAPSAPSEAPPSASKLAADPTPVLPAQSSPVVQDIAPANPDTAAAPAPTDTANSTPVVAAPTAVANTPSSPAVAAPSASPPEISSPAPVETAASAPAAGISSTVALDSTSAAPQASSADAQTSILSTPDATGAGATPTVVASSTALGAGASVSSDPNAAASTTDVGSSLVAAAPVAVTNSNPAASATSDVGDGAFSAASQATPTGASISAPQSQANIAAETSGASLSSNPTAISNNAVSATDSPSSVSDPLLSGTQTAGAQSLVPVSPQNSGNAISAAPALQSEAVGTGPDGGVILTSAARTGDNPDATGAAGGTSTLEKTSGPLSSGASKAGVAIAISVGVVAIGVIIWFIIHRVFRNRRTGRKADTPPASPLLPALNSPLPAGIARAMSQRSAASSGMGNSNFWASGQGAIMNSDADPFSDKIPTSTGMRVETDMGDVLREKEYGFKTNNIGPAPLSPLPSLPYGGVNGLGAKNSGFSLFPQSSGASNGKGPNEFPKHF